VAKIHFVQFGKKQIKMFNYLKFLIKFIIPEKLRKRIVCVKNKLKGKFIEKKKFNCNLFKNSPIIYVLCPDNNIPIGGIKYLYKHVDVLNRNNFSAVILHSNFGFRCDWFDNNTKVAYRSEIKLESKDFLVIPEVYGPGLAGIEKGTKKVILNQNAHYTFNGYSLERHDLITAYLNKDIVGVFCISEHIYNYFKYIFPELNIFRAHLGIDNKLFRHNSNKEKRIAFMPRKLPQDALQVINILKFRGVLNNFELEAIDKVSEAKVADILGKSLFFLSFCDREGCGLPPLEAMSSGCVVIGYHGIGGKEYFNEDFCYPIESTDVLTFAKTIEKVTQEYSNNPDFVLTKGKKAAEYVNKVYSLERESEDIVRFWKQLIL